MTTTNKEGFLPHRKDIGDSLPRVLVPVDGSDISSKAIKLASESYRNRRIIPFSPIVVSRSLPLDASLPDEVSKSEEWLSMGVEGIKTAKDVKKVASEEEGDIVQTRNRGVAIIKEAEETNSSTVVIGDSGETDTGLNDTSNYLLSHFKGEVIIYRAAKGRR